MSQYVDGAPAPSCPPPLQAPDLISVLVRSMARETLAAALASVDRQSWPAIELVVVNATGRAHPPLPAGRVPRRILESNQPLPRAAAANRALAAAQGRWMLFLDDDDEMDPGHLARLRDALLQHPGVRVAHAGVRLVDDAGRVHGTLDEPVDRISLWSANRLAIHSVLFERSIIDEGLRFDECFAVYEDWDWWFQVAQRERFLHVAGVSAAYRLIGSSGVTMPHDRTSSRDLRLPFYRKWLVQLDAAELEELCASGEHARGDLKEGLRQLSEAQRAASELAVASKSLLDRLAASEAEAADHAAKAESLSICLAEIKADLIREANVSTSLRHSVEAQTGALAECQGLIERAENRLDQALQNYTRLEQGYLAVTSSLSWRLTQPLRSARGLFCRRRKRPI